MENFNLKEVAFRLKNLREMSDIKVETMAKAVGFTEEEYLSYELGENDFSFNFLFNCAKVLCVNITELITGDSAKLHVFELNRKGEGMPIVRRKGFNYLHLASNMSDRLAEPFVVTVPYDDALDMTSISLSSHDGQEMDYVLEGALKVNIDGHVMVLNAGDSVYYDSSRPHGMVSTGGNNCKFLAVVLKK